MSKSEVEKFFIIRSESNFERACEAAWERAVFIWQIDDCGHCQRLPDFHRSESSVHVKFVGYECSGGMGGIHHYYFFETWMEKVDRKVEE